MISQANQITMSDLKEDRGRKGVKLCGARKRRRMRKRNEKRREEHACAFYGDQPPIWYEMYAAYTGNRYPAGTDADHYDRIQK